MSKFRFIYEPEDFSKPSKTIIYKLLEEIGAGTFERELENMKLPKPLTQKGFYLEHRAETMFLCYRYPVGCTSLNESGLARFKVKL